MGLGASRLTPEIMSAAKQLVDSTISGNKARQQPAPGELPSPGAPCCPAPTYVAASHSLTRFPCALCHGRWSSSARRETRLAQDAAGGRCCVACLPAPRLPLPALTPGLSLHAPPLHALTLPAPTCCSYCPYCVKGRLACLPACPAPGVLLPSPAGRAPAVCSPAPLAGAAPRWPALLRAPCACCARWRRQARPGEVPTKEQDHCD